MVVRHQLFDQSLHTHTKENSADSIHGLFAKRELRRHDQDHANRQCKTVIQSQDSVADYFFHGFAPHIKRR